MEIRSNSADVGVELERVAIALSNPTPALEQIASMMRSRFAESLARGVSPEGVPHAPLKTLRRSTRRGGNLANTLFVAVTENKAEVGYESAIAIIYDQGARIPARKLVPKKRQALFWAGAKHPVKSVNVPEVVISPRPLVGYSEDDIDAMNERISNAWNL